MSVTRRKAIGMAAAAAGATIVAPRGAFASRGRSLGSARLNGIATSPDHTRIWVTYVGRLPGFHDRHGGVIELPAF